MTMMHAQKPGILRIFSLTAEVFPNLKRLMVPRLPELFHGIHRPSDKPAPCPAPDRILLSCSLYGKGDGTGFC